MRILFWGLGVPTLVLLWQIVWWRLRRPRDHQRALGLALLIAVGGLFVLCLFPYAPASFCLPQGWLAAFYATTLAAAVSTLYLITYGGLEARSPSTVLVVAAQQSPGGLTAQDAARLFSDEEFIVERVEGLIRAGQLQRQQDRLFLTLHGRIFLGAFLLPRRLMGLKHWGG
jgi:hypothetical protein